MKKILLFTIISITFWFIFDQYLLTKFNISGTIINPSNKNYSIQAGDVLKVGFCRSYFLSHIAGINILHYAVVIQIEDKLYVVHYYNRKRNVKNIIIFPYSVKLSSYEDFIKTFEYRYIIIYRHPINRIKTTWSEFLQFSSQFKKFYNCVHFVLFFLNKYVSNKFYELTILNINFYFNEIFGFEFLTRTLIKEGYVPSDVLSVENYINLEII